MRLSRGLSFGLLVLLGCGRIGYDAPDASALPDDSSTPDTSVDTSIAADTSVMVDGMTGTVAATELEVTLAREDTVIALPDRLPEAITGAAASVDGEVVYVVGGSGTPFSASNCTADVVVYGPEGMSTMADELPVPIQGLGAIHIGETLHSMMGYCGGATADEQSVYRHPMGGAPPELVGMFPTGAYYPAVGQVSGVDATATIVVAGGFGSGPLRNFIQTMNPEDGTAAELTTTLPSHRCLAAGASIGGSFYVIGGSTNTNCVPPGSSPTVDLTDEVVRITLAPEAAEVVATLPSPVAAACSVTLGDGTVALFGGLEYVDDGSGGFTRQASDRIMIFDPETNETWTHAASLPSPRAHMGCARTSDNRVLLFGGVGDGGVLSDEVMLFAPFESSGERVGMLDSGQIGANWESLTIDAEVPAGTSITYAVRVSDDTDSPGAWVEVTPGTLPAEVPDGQFLEWRATLSSTSPSVAPIITGVEATFSFGGT
jgi:hypothetical protein